MRNGCVLTCHKIKQNLFVEHKLIMNGIAPRKQYSHILEQPPALSISRPVLYNLDSSIDP